MTDLFEKFYEKSKLNIDIEYFPLFKYTKNLKKILNELKFNKKIELVSILENKIIANLNLDFSPDMIIPVPINPERLKERGFNQAELLIKKYAFLHKIPIRNDIIFRLYNTKKMFSLSPDERKVESSNAFAIWPNKIPEIKGKNIIIFDDIITTGNTVHEIYKILSLYEPMGIIAVCLARP